ASARPGDALGAYDRAAHSVDMVTARLDDDLDRAAYRGRHLRPFDGAIRVLLAGPPSRARTDGLLIWSERRKAAALTLALGGSRRSATSPPLVPVGVEALGRRLSPRDAL